MANVCASHFYLAGFSEQRLKELIAKRLKGTDRVDDLLEQLDKPEMSCLREMMSSTPLLANMICKLYAGGQLNLANATKTNLYQMMRDRIVQRYKQGRSGADTSLSVSEVHSGLDDLAKMALSGLTEERFLFEVAEVERCCSRVAQGLGFLGDYLEAEETCESFVQFSHLTWQEYFAAYAVARSSDPIATAKEAVKGVGVGEHTYGFWQFVSGQLAVKLLPDLIDLLQRASKNAATSPLSSRTTIWLLSCIVEACKQPPSTNGVTKKSPPPCKTIRNAVIQVATNQCIDLSHHMCSVEDVDTVAFCLSQCPDITHLKLWSCGVGVNHCRVLLKGLHYVEKLDLSGNSGLHESGALNVLVDCEGDTGLAASDRLASLDLDVCSLTEDDCAPLKVLLKRTTSLKCLFLNQNNLNSQAAILLCEGLQRNNCPLLKLFLSSNKIGSAAGGALGDASSRVSLHVLNLNDNQLGDDGASDLFDSIAKPACLSVLGLDRNGLTSVAVDAIALLAASSVASPQTSHAIPRATNFVRRVRRRVNHVHTPSQGQESNCTSGAVVDSSLAPAERRPMPNATYLNGNSLRVSDLQRLAKCMPRNDSETAIVCDMYVVRCGRVQEIDSSVRVADQLKSKSTTTFSVFSTALRDSHLTKITRQLSVNLRIKEVELLHNLIGDSGAAILSAMLRMNTAITYLSLSFNDISAAGFSQLVLAITEGNTTLKRLCLSRNPIFKSDDPVTRQEAARSLGRLLSCPQLDYLGLSSTGVGDIEASTMADTLSKDTCGVRILVLGGNRISSVGAAALAEGIQSNASLQLVSLASNDIGNDGAKKIAASLQARDESANPVHRVFFGDNPASASLFYKGMLNSHCWHRHPSDAICLAVNCCARHQLPGQKSVL